MRARSSLLWFLPSPSPRAQGAARTAWPVFRLTDASLDGWRSLHLPCRVNRSRTSDDWAGWASPTATGSVDPSRWRLEAFGSPLSARGATVFNLPSAGPSPLPRAVKSKGPAPGPKIRDCLWLTESDRWVRGKGAGVSAGAARRARRKCRRMLGGALTPVLDDPPPFFFLLLLLRSSRSCLRAAAIGIGPHSRPRSTASP